MNNMKINGIDLCIGCMRPLEQNGTCSYCHFTQEKYHPIPRCLQPGTWLANRYVLGRVLGEGSFGISYIAWDSLLEVVVAIKEYFPSNLVSRHVGDGKDTKVYIYEKAEKQKYQENLKKYLNEAKSLSVVSELEGIVSVKDFFYGNNTAYIVMAYIDGISLKQYVEEHGRINGKKLLCMMKPVLVSLGRVHETGMLHRDISPDNILITKDEKLVLIDFGAARKENISMTRSMTVVFKRGYSPEEQYRSRGKQGAWSDIYALCATIYYALVGQAPDEAIERVLEDEMLSLTDMPEIELTQAQKKAVMKGIAVKPQERYQSVEALYRALYQEENTDRKTVILKMRLVIILVIIVIIGAGWGFARISKEYFGNPAKTDRETGVLASGNAESSVLKNQKEEMIIDSYEGLTQKEAQALSEQREDENLTIQWRKRYSDTVKKGRVIHQSIRSGTRYQSGEYSVLIITVSRGKRKVIMPDVTGKTKSAARKILRKKGLTWEIRIRESIQEKNKVLEQSVKKGKKVTHGTKITLTVSSGIVRATPASQTVPPPAPSPVQKGNGSTSDKTRSSNEDTFVGVIP